MLTSLVAFLRGVARRGTISREVDDELQFHLTQEIAANVARGMPATEARRVALRDLGGLTQTREAVREVRTVRLESLWLDLSTALRSLRATPGVTAFILGILTLTVAAATVTFSVVDAVVLRALPFDNSHQLVAVTYDRGDRVMSQVRSLSALQFLALRDGMDSVSSLAAVARGSYALKGGAEPERVWSARVSASLFETLHVRPLLGTAFTADHEVAGNERVAVIGHGLWRRRFGSDPGVVGRTIDAVEGQLLVLGVMPEGFSYPLVDDRLPEIWTPYVIPERERQPAQQSSYLHLVGRLKPGASLIQAQSQVDAVRATLATAEPDRYSPASRFSITPLDEVVVGPVRGWMVLVLLAVTLLLVVACANVANLLLTRAVDRARELSIRAALGASRARLVRSLLIESLLLSSCAVVLALIVASWGIDATKASLPTGIARAQMIALNLRVFGTAVVTAIVTGLLFGVVPALHLSREDLVSALKQGSSTMTGARRAWRASVLITELAFATVLLVATTLFVSSFVRLSRADLGFDRSDLLVVGSAEGIRGTVADVVHHLESVPGVVSAGGAAAGSPPLIAAGFEGGSSGTRLQLPQAPAAFVNVEFNRVSARYFAAASIPVLRGRVFLDGDSMSSPLVVLDELAARRLFGDTDPIGRELIAYGRTRVSVAGVVANVRMRGPEEDSGPQAYFLGPASGDNYSYLVRTSGDAAKMIPAVQAAFASLRAEGSRPADVRRVEDAFRNITARRRFSAGTMALFGLLALLIGATGVYGVMSSLVAQRTREIGVRVALGASRPRILGTVLGQVARYLALGLTVGLPSAWLVSRTFTALFFQVQPGDSWVYLLVASLLTAVSLAAAFIPARRASRVDPLVALRTQ
jgi:predicted permease